jgi:hypothetical protein
MSETDDYHPEDSLRAAGRSFWDSITEAHDLDGVQRVLLLEACRLTDHINDLHHAAMTDGKTLRVVEVNGRKVALTVKDPVRLYIWPQGRPHSEGSCPAVHLVHQDAHVDARGHAPPR